MQRGSSPFTANNAAFSLTSHHGRPVVSGDPGNPNTDPVLSANEAELVAKVAELVLESSTFLHLPTPSHQAVFIVELPSLSGRA